MMTSKPQDASPVVFAARLPRTSPATAGTPTPRISVVVPIFNEQENLHELYRRLVAVLEAIGETFELILINDGCVDHSARLIDDFSSRDPRVVGIHLSRNFGHQPAVSAGLDHARGAAVIVMDGDLQDPPEVLPMLLDEWQRGQEVVYAIRSKRKEGPLLRASYFLFYRLLHAISDLEIPLDSGDFCLMDRKVVNVLKHLPERGRFIRGLRTFVGFRQIGIRYERHSRAAGTPKYTFRKLVALAMDGLVSFSGYPLQMVTYLGLTTTLAALALLVWVIFDSITSQSTPRGWASTMVVVLVMSAIQLLSLGVIGQYVRRIFAEVKGRPTYIVRDIVSRDPSRQESVRE